MTLRLVRDDEQQPQTWVFDPAILPDLELIPRLIHLDEVRRLRSLPLAWEISHRVLRVQHWARYYGLTTRALTALATGLQHTTRR